MYDYGSFFRIIRSRKTLLFVTVTKPLPFIKKNGLVKVTFIAEG